MTGESYQKTMGKARNYIPALAYGHKIMPQDLAGQIGLPHVGNVIYVDPTNGSDTANDGSDQNRALKTATAAHSAAVDNHHDVVVVVPGEVGSGSGTAETAALTWSKDHTHLVGNSAPSRVSQRSRVLFTTAATSPQMTVSAMGCIFANVQIATFVDANILLTVSGQRNVFRNVHIAGIGDATAGDDTAARSLKLTGSENHFDDCVIGLDTVARSVANSEIELSGGATRNSFRDCLVVAFADNAGHFFVTAPDSGGIDRWTIFERTLFINAVDSTATAMTEAFNVHASAGGHIILKDCTLVGATDWEAATVSGLVLIDGAAPTAATSGLAVDVAAS